MGLSPRTWGNPAHRHIRPVGDGPIPTHVGEPCASAAPPTSSRAYPHARGGTEAARHLIGGVEGLSPRTWGNRLAQVVGRRLQGPIPTHVGEPVPPTVLCQSRRGLSPRTWGNQQRLNSRPPVRGPIPTHVGEP